MTTKSASKEMIVAQVIAIVERVGAPEGIEAVDVELKGVGNSRLLRIYIDKPGGVTHTDCEFISRNVGTILDVDDVVPGSGYRLEVSSPGLERPLRRASDFERFVGRGVKVLLREPVAEERRWEGVLVSFSDGNITLKLATGEPVTFGFGQVERAKLKFEW